MLFAAPAAAQESAVSPVACERLAGSLTLPNTTVTAAGARAGEAGLPAHCRVALTIRPSSDSDIKSEIWLPLTGWNGRFLAVGNGAWGGSIQYAALADALKRGYAAASTDTGHTGAAASFAVGHPEKLIDFGYRSVHETAVQGKATVQAKAGGRFSWQHKRSEHAHTGALLELRKDRRISFTWESTNRASEVALEAQPMPYGTLVSVHHTGLLRMNPGQLFSQRMYWWRLLERLRCYFYFKGKIRAAD